MNSQIETMNSVLYRTLLRLRPEAETARICHKLKADVHGLFRRRGVVVGASGGVDSSVVLALCVRAFGAEKVLAVIMPECESSPESAELAQGWCDALGVETIHEDITGALEELGCYRRRDEAIKRVFPEYGAGWTSKITLPGSLLQDETLNVFSLVVVDPEGEEYRERILSADFYQIVAASNFKQRTRMTMLYHHAELRNYAVVGTANKNEHDLGFFVKHGDGAADVAPILHLFKTQVYELAEFLGVPTEIRSRPPTSDTYSAGSTQEEFFFRVPFNMLDLIWVSIENEVPIDDIAEALNITSEQVQRVIDDIHRKRRTTLYLRTHALSYAEKDEREAGGRA